MPESLLSTMATSVYAALLDWYRPAVIMEFYESNCLEPTSDADRRARDFYDFMGQTMCATLLYGQIAVRAFEG